MLWVPGIPYGTGAVFESACVVGVGRVGKAMAARLGERIPTQIAGRDLECGDAELVRQSSRAPIIESMSASGAASDTA